MHCLDLLQNGSSWSLDRKKVRCSFRVNVTPKDMRHGREQLDELARSVGRDPASLHITVFEPPADRDLIACYAAAGADRVVLRPRGSSAEVVLSEMEHIAAWACV